MGILQRLACHFGFHKWSLFSEPKQEVWGEFQNGTGVKLREFVKVIQTRRCQDCREFDRREIVS